MNTFQHLAKLREVHPEASALYHKSPALYGMWMVILEEVAHTGYRNQENSYTLDRSEAWWKEVLSVSKKKLRDVFTAMSWMGVITSKEHDGWIEVSAPILTQMRSEYEKKRDRKIGKFRDTYTQSCTQGTEDEKSSYSKTGTIENKAVSKKMSGHIESEQPPREKQEDSKTGTIKNKAVSKKVSGHPHRTHTGKKNTLLCKYAAIENNAVSNEVSGHSGGNTVDSENAATGKLGAIKNNAVSDKVSGHVVRMIVAKKEDVDISVKLCKNNEILVTKVPRKKRSIYINNKYLKENTKERKKKRTHESSFVKSKTPAHIPSPSGKTSNYPSSELKTTLAAIVQLHEAKYGTYSDYGTKAIKGRVAGMLKTWSSKGIPLDSVLAAFSEFLSIDAYKVIRRRHAWQEFVSQFPSLLRMQVPPSETSVALATLLATQITSELPGLYEAGKVPIIPWAREFDDYLAHSSAAVENLQKIVEWFPSNEFWATKITGASSVCKHYTKLMASMVSDIRTPAKKGSVLKLQCPKTYDYTGASRVIVSRSKV